MTITTLRVIRIDPAQRSIEQLLVEPEGIAALLPTEDPETIDMVPAHGLVIDNSQHTADHPTRFRLSEGELKRPFFGPALVVGISNGNWVSAALSIEWVRTRVVWEVWHPEQERYDDSTTPAE